MRTTIAIFVVLCSGLFAAPAPAQTASAEEATIRILIERHAVASRERNLRGLVDLYHPDAQIVYGNGQVVSRDVMEKDYAAALDSPPVRSGRHHLHPPESIRTRFLRPDVALVEVASYSVGGTDPDGKSLPSW
jgi:ketosteroid isomerase-like protein